jgi:hydrogenase-4 component E
MSLDTILPGLAHLLGGGILLLSFMLVLRRRVVAAINSLSGQGVLLALLGLCHAWDRADSMLALVALLLAAGQGLLLPLALREWVRRQGLRQDSGAVPASRPLAGLLAAVALVLLAVMTLAPVTAGAAAAMREDLVLALAVMLIGLLVMASRRGQHGGPLGQAIGLASLMNGALLAALATPGLPLMPALAIVAMAVPFATVAAFLTLRPQVGEDPA